MKPLIINTIKNKYTSAFLSALFFFLSIEVRVSLVAFAVLFLVVFILRTVDISNTGDVTLRRDRH